MPIAGQNSASRARAHIRWAARYNELGDVGRAHAHFGRALEYDRRSSGFGSGPVLHSGTTGDLATAMLGLAELRYSASSDVMWTGEMSAIHESNLPSRDMLHQFDYAGTIDGHAILISITEDPGLQCPCVVVSAGPTRVEIYILHIGNANIGELERTYGRAVQNQMGNYTAHTGDMDKLHSAVANALDRRVVCVGSVRGHLDEVDRPMRLVHAAAAFLAQKGMISGASLVVVDEQCYVGEGDSRPGTLHRWLNDPKSTSTYQLKPLGSGLMIARADELVSPVLPRHPYAHIREREIGARVTGPSAKRAKRTDP